MTPPLGPKINASSKKPRTMANAAARFPGEHPSEKAPKTTAKNHDPLKLLAVMYAYKYEILV